jgi:hypothetical protein
MATSGNIADSSEFMTLTDQEIDWAMDLKAAMVKADAKFAETITDFEYAQHAIVAKEKISKGLRRIRRLQEFKQKYGILKLNEATMTADQFREIFKRLEAKAPGLFTSFGREEREGEAQGRHVAAMDYTTFLPVNFVTEIDDEDLFVAFYFYLEATQPDILAVRQGVAFILQCKGIGWKNFSRDMEQKASSLYNDAYPVRITEMSVLNANRLMKIFYALCKPFLGKRVKEVFQMNAVVADVLKRYSKELLPTTLGGMQTQMDMMDKVVDSLQTRLENKTTFKL